MTSALATSPANDARTFDAMACFAPSDDSPRMTELRGRLSTARCVASSAIGRWHDHPDDARALYAIIAQTACEFVYANVPIETLDAAVTLCRRLLVAARLIEELKGGPYAAH